VYEVIQGTPAEKADIRVGMKVVKFQGDDLSEDMKWSTLKKKMRETEKPWKFTFQS
tara:strand:+ start:183 stop:350 length:168 start_codon:yes stop_codon:yes gene_type:complete